MSQSNFDRIVSMIDFWDVFFFFLELKSACFGYLFFLIMLFLKIFVLEFYIYIFIYTIFLMFLIKIVNDWSMMENFEIGWSK